MDNIISNFVFKRTYARTLPDGSRESYPQTIKRFLDFSFGLEDQHMDTIGLPRLDHTEERARLEGNLLARRQFPSGRSLWVAGEERSAIPLANFNCSYINIKRHEDFKDVLYMLMVGSGVGFRYRKESNISFPNAHLMNLEVFSKKKYKEYDVLIVAEDSKEGLVDALGELLSIAATTEKPISVGLSLEKLRPEGAPLKTFGGTSSGPAPFKKMFAGIFDIIKKSRVLKGFDILNIINMLGAAVVVGGVRRTAQIALFEPDDVDSFFAKYAMYGIFGEEAATRHAKVIKKAAEVFGKENLPEWLYNIEINKEAPRGDLSHRSVSNNSVAFVKKPTKEYLELLALMQEGEGEPGMYNMEAAAKRVAESLGSGPEAYKEIAEEIGTNPCGEVILFSKNVCNLTTINLKGFVVGGILDLKGAKEAMRLSARIALRMTLPVLELEDWELTKNRDRLLGTSITGYQDAIGACAKDYRGCITCNGINLPEAAILRLLRDAAVEEARSYSHQLRVCNPMFVTTMKPEGTLSQVAGGVSSGAMYAFAPFYIRRVRISANDPLAKAAIDSGVPFYAEVGTAGKFSLEDLSKEEVIASARTLVLEFPIISTSSVFEGDVDLKVQFANYFKFQEAFSDMNTSNTIKVKPTEFVSIPEVLYDRWDDFVGVAFLPDHGGSYLLAPYEEISEEDCLTRIAAIKSSDFMDTDAPSQEDSIIDDDCAGGACPAR